MISAGRRPARSYYRGFLSKGDEIRAILRMRSDVRKQFWRLVRRRGFIKGVNRLTGAYVRRYLRANSDFAQFVSDLPNVLTRLDRFDDSAILEMKLARAASSNIRRDDYFRRSDILDEFSWGLEDFRRDFLQGIPSVQGHRNLRRRRVHFSELYL